MAKRLEFDIDGKKLIFRDKKEAFDYLNKKQSIEDYLNNKFIKTNSFKKIKNIRQYIFNYFSKNQDIDFNGTCIMCKKDTEFNSLTNKYCRLCSKKCINDYSEEFKKRMNNVHGRSYYTQDPNALKQMLNQRTLTKKYKIGEYEYNVTGQYEEDFLDFMFHILHCNPKDLIECPFNIPYTFNGTERIYMPDFYIPSLHLVIEIKSSLSAYAERDKEFEEAKRKAGEMYMKEKHGYYFYLNDKRYKEFLDFLSHIIEK